MNRPVLTILINWLRLHKALAITRCAGLPKKETGKVVPTWNCMVIHAHCTLLAVHDPHQVLKIITELNEQPEASRPYPWHISDAPIEFTERLASNIVGNELKISPMQCKWEVSQNQQSVARGLLAEVCDAQTQMALFVESHGAKTMEG